MFYFFRHSSIVMAVLLTAIFAVSCRENLPEEGVGRDLAVQREKNIKDISYDLSFIVPEDKETALSGEEVLSFKMEKRTSLLLDFRPSPDGILSVRVGGKDVRYLAGREHILIPSKYLRRGENRVEISFVPEDQSLNRRNDYLYTLLVPERARTVFPCFDQPDMKARFSLSLVLPSEWTAVTQGKLLSDTPDGKNHKMVFSESEPISTYLFAFAAGRWQSTTEERAGRSITAFYRETDPAKLSQWGEIFDEVFFAIDWMEDYTGIPMPFQKFDIVIVPGFQFGGMEHPGAIFLNDKRIFLPRNPTTSERLSRTDLISHETAHMWFGDLVTMKWFNDVWTKEVFANYFSSKITTPLRPDVNTALRDFNSFNVTSYEEDRTTGSVSVRQPLPNLRYAGLIYGNSVYDKAPIVMRMLSTILGDKEFQTGLKEYLAKYSFSNATWDDLIDILDAHTRVDLRSWSRSWVDAEGMPCFDTRYEGGKIVIRQTDPLDRGLLWPQNVDVTLLSKDGVSVQRTLWTDSQEVSESVPFEDEDPIVLPNLSALAYGYFPLGEKAQEFLQAGGAQKISSPEGRISVLSSLWEDCLRGKVDEKIVFDVFRSHLLWEKDPVTSSTLLGYLRNMSRHGTMALSSDIEECFKVLSLKAPLSETRLSSLRALFGCFTSEETTEELYDVWRSQALPVSYKGVDLSGSDYRTLAYELSLRKPECYDEFRAIQRGRIQDPDTRAEFDFIIRSVSPVKEKRDSLFNSFLAPEGRRMEPWVATSLRYLNHPLRGDEALSYILPSLREMPSVQKTGDIFFPKNWASAVLSPHDSKQASSIVKDFLSDSGEMPPLLSNKIRQSAYYLFKDE